MKYINILIINLIVLFLFYNNSMAYLGPGMAGGVIAATLGILIAIIAAIFGLIWFPLKKILHKKKNKKKK